MRRHLVRSYGALLVAVLLSLAVPLAAASVGRDSQHLAADRLSDVAYLAKLAEPALRTGESAALDTALSRYEQVYDIHGAVIDADRRVVVSSDPTGRIVDLAAAATADRPDTAGAVRRALAGEQVGFDTRVWPWGPEWLVVAAPIGTGGEVSGAVVTVSSTAGLRAATARNWLLVAAAATAPLGLCVLAANWLANWTLRPVRRLDAAAQELAADGYAVRVPADAGPPELRRLVQEFNQMADTVAEALARQRAFVAQASHQLRNPLTALLLRIETLGEEPLTPDGRIDHRLAVEEVERLHQMLEGLLTLARIERHDDPIETIDAVATAAARVRAWQPLARARGVTLALDATVPAAPVRSVVTGLCQILDALIDNALKFGARTVTVRVTDDDGPRVEVVDDGRGMTPEQRQRATERFWRAGDAQNQAGHGLGLSIATALTEASGGTLVLAGADGGGLRAGLELRPAAQPPPAAAPAC
ncbi:HAMP domain-containing histidine kinase [Micromonospora sp. PLK6-60]|uniref:sensor histidine kinase n=1 Tax=Micromonospora sp. PLK6-60 TaxID=2873383 RepID=UPI001CA624B8|nr:HAMP domain-containing sensor histidine kinase [Micromonospora sp. PLK6-60]MBY8870987.1 HAMP domain-containing histidine kinase [Micromonospora sp. PLK6-60]